TPTSFSGTGIAGASLTVTQGGNQLASVTIANDGTFSGSATLPFGTHGIAFREESTLAAAIAGATCSQNPLSGQFVCDRLIGETLTRPFPAFAVSEPADSATIDGTAVAFHGTGIPGSNVEIGVLGAPLFGTNLTIAPDGTFSGSVSLVNSSGV